MITQVIVSDPDKYDQTGVLCIVYPFGSEMPNFAIEVRKYCIDLTGSALLAPSKVRMVAQALFRAASLSEMSYEEIYEGVSVSQSDEGYSQV